MTQYSLQHGKIQSCIYHFQIKDGRNDQHIQQEHLLESSYPATKLTSIEQSKPFFLIRKTTKNNDEHNTCMNK
jgi:hypothetical protein